ncbi:MAG TPA: histidinol dehydrogenase [Sediminibacterium sp.]|nr:histidinol dehydrogenase [Sediminibacterium sp.]
MRIISYPPASEWPSLLRRPSLDHLTLQDTVREVMQQVKQAGDAALRAYTRQFDGVDLSEFRVPDAAIAAARIQISDELYGAMELAAQNIRRFHEKQVQEPEKIATRSGVVCWRKPVPIEKVGLYIPGGTAPLFSTILMLGIPASLAGCSEIVLCSPPGQDGKLNPAILVAAQLTGITAVYAIGGVQAIAAMTYGTESVPKVYKIFGPGNQYVTCAKQLAQQEGLAIDMPAGPSEVCVLADETANADFIAADLLSQAEHGADSQVLLVTVSAGFAESVSQALQQQLGDLPRKNFAEKSLSNSIAILAADMDTAIEIVNSYAAEHLIIACRQADRISEKIKNAGSVFIGHYSPESAGDYASGTNHTLPTNGYARAYSGVSVDSFVKKITFQQLTPEGLETIGPAVMAMARAEGLEAHARAVAIRLDTLNRK